MIRASGALGSLLLGLLACNPDKPTSSDSGSADSGSSESGPADSGGAVWYPDLDGDGYGDATADPVGSSAPVANIASNAEDCNDRDADIHPGADELCNNKDDDCDGQIDEDPVVGGAWYPDGDGDGYGDADTTPVDACSAPPGLLEDHSDCDDGDPSVYPGAFEDCENGIDDDCDGTVDEESGVMVWPDADGDTYGAEGLEMDACMAPTSGIATRGGDCDDSAASINPDFPEVCDGIDNDCDGLVDGDEAGVGSAWYIDTDGDGYGTDIEYVSGCDIPPGDVDNPYDCDGDDPNIHPFATEICDNGIDENCDTVDSACGGPWGDHGLAEADAAIYAGDDDGALAYSVGSAGDTNGDGATDFWIGAPNDDEWGGRVYLVSGTVRGSETISDVATAVLMARGTGSYIGLALHDAGNLDQNGDGYPDVWVGSPKDYNADWVRSGAVELMLGPFSGTEDLNDSDLRWMGIDEGDFTGESIATGQDLNGDGTPDNIFGAHCRSLATGEPGSVFITYGDEVGGERSLSDANIEIHGTMHYEEIGIRVDFLGDTDGDGQSDVGIGVPGYDKDGEYGAIEVLTALPADGTYGVDDVGQLITSGSSAAGTGIGQTISGVGDLDGDGYDDFAVGAEDDATSGRYSGALYLVEGPAGSLSTIDEAFAEWTGPNAWQYVENAEGGKDLDGDGQPDLVIGNDGVDDEVNGSTWVLRGPFESGTHSLATADATWMGEYRHNGGGFSLALLDDTNADGYADLLVGAVDYDDAGAAYLILGGPD